MERPCSKSIPTTPGVYLYKDKQGRIIYVGKARDLRKRVLSYFRDKSSLTPKTQALMNRAVSLETIATSTEKEALLLESSLIKKHRPKYNIVLRDDKQYALFRIQRGTPYPRLEIVRKANKDDARYFGPFTSALAARATWKILHHLFPLRRCSDRAFKNRVRPCLYFYLRQCLAPCVETVDPKDYAALVEQVELFLSGRSEELLQTLQKEMEHAVNILAFEKAAVIRDQMQSIRKTIEKQYVVMPDGGDMDVVGVTIDEKGLGVGLLFVREGKLIDKKAFFFSGLSFEDIPELLLSFLSQTYSSAAYVPPKIILPRVLEEKALAKYAYFYQLKETEESLAELREAPVLISVARTADETKLVDIAVVNARETVKGLLEEPLSAKLAKVFHRDEPILRIECVDVSHTGGKNTRIGMVVFEDGEPKKDEYRLYSLEEEASIAGGDDYGAIASWMRRRVKAGSPWADLVLIDGGRGQVSAARRALDEVMASPPFVLAGIAKARNAVGRPDRRAGNIEDAIFLSGRVNPLPLKAGSPELLFLQRVRDTAHTFVYRRHRRARESSMLSEELLKVPGIGKVTARLLWKRFKSMSAIINAKPEELQEIQGISLTKARVLSERLKALRN